jgi:hypothetical protein
LRHLPEWQELRAILSIERTFDTVRGWRQQFEYFRFETFRFETPRPGDGSNASPVTRVRPASRATVD